MGTSNADNHGRPIVSRLHRRRLLQLGWNGLLSAGTIAGLGLIGSGCESRTVPGAGGSFRRIALSNRPSQNIAFTLLDAGDDLILWLSQAAGAEPLAYALNRPAQLIWSLCDSRRTETEVAKEYARLTGRRETEAQGFLAELIERHLVVTGGYLVLSDDFRRQLPRQEGAWRRIDNV